MRRAAIPLAVIALASASLAGALLAGAPETSLRPVARPAQLGPAKAAPVPQPARSADQTPATRRDDAARKQLEITQTDDRGGLLASLRPILRPLGIGRKARERKAALARGAVCGDPAIQGQEIGRVPGRITGCGIENAVKVRSIGGVALSQHAVMDCQTARTIKAWVQKGMAPAVGGYGGGVAQLRVAAHYACRSRNNQKGAKISEHGKGHAIDIAGFTLRDGRTITVLSDWGGGQKGQILKQMHRSACGPFGTVLGPESDRFHRDHFHFDTARYRSGSYCR